jgi:hypothetical protein
MNCDTCKENQLREYLAKLETVLKSFIPEPKGTETPCEKFFIYGRREGIRNAIDILKAHGETTEPAVENHPQELLGLTLGELLSRYGDIAGLERHVRILKDLTILEEKFRALEQKNLGFPEARPPI